jgi:anti-anti-sigma regulatory factor
MNSETNQATQVVQENPGTILDMSGSQDIVLVQSLYQQLSDILESGNPVTFDVSQTERVDTAVAQLLLSFSQAARKKNQSVSWQQPSEAFLKAVGLLGLGEELGIAA